MNPLSEGQLERLRRRQNREELENQTKATTQTQIDGTERPKTRGFKFGLWIGNRLPNWLREWVADVVPKLARVIGIVALCIFGLFLVANALSDWKDYQRDRDNKGEIEHEHDTPVWIQGDWMVGEYRNCQMRTKTVPPDRKDLDTLDKLPRLFCGEDENGLFDFQKVIAPPSSNISAPAPGTMYLIGVTAGEYDSDFHILPVSYWGRIDRTDKWVIEWRCQRRNESVECKTTN